MPDFSVVIPVFNSEKFIEPVYGELNSTFIALNKSFEIIFVDDGSTDSSVAKILALKQKNSPIKLVRLKKNYGQYVATACGLYTATGNHIITADADVASPPGSVLSLLKQSSTTAELIYAEPPFLQRSLFRKCGTMIFDTIIRASVKTADLSNHSGSSLRVIKRELAEKTLRNLPHPLLLDISLMNLAKDKVRFVQINFEPAHSDSSYSNIKLIMQGIGLIFAILINRMIHRNAMNPSSFIREVVHN